MSEPKHETESLPSAANTVAASPCIDAPFTVHLTYSGKTIEIPTGRSILDTLEEHGVVVASVCREGICGTCECAVVEGAVDHRDQVLTPEERAENRSMMICVSRAAGAELVLDL